MADDVVRRIIGDDLFMPAALRAAAAARSLAEKIEAARKRREDD